MLKVASLFTGGFGSFAYTLRELGIEHKTLFGCELLKPQRECYNLNYGEPDEWFYDITKADFSKYHGKIDILQASPVCKSYSMAGNRRGLASDDGLLMDKTIQALAIIQPKVFIVENSASLTSVNKGMDWKLILQQFNKLEGYTISWGKMNERNYGIPQNRNRLFIIGFRAKTYKFHFPERNPLELCTADLLEKDVPQKYDLSDRMLEGFRVHAERHKSKGGGFAMKVLDTSGVCKAITTKCGNRATDPFIKRDNGKIRRLTPREQARIMGDLEDKFKFGNFSNTKLSEFIGNAIGLGTMRALLKDIIEVYNQTDFNNPIVQTIEPIKPIVQGSLF